MVLCEAWWAPAVSFNSNWFIGANPSYACRDVFACSMPNSVTSVHQWRRERCAACMWTNQLFRKIQRWLLLSMSLCMVKYCHWCISKRSLIQAEWNDGDACTRHIWTACHLTIMRTKVFIHSHTSTHIYNSDKNMK